MAKYKEYLRKMLDENKEVFDNFREIHNAYSIDPIVIQRKFNQEGKKILEIIHEYENRLCANTERGIYNKFSVGLAEKFQNEIRKIFPKIDFIGLIPEKNPPEEVKSEAFIIKKINL